MPSSIPIPAARRSEDSGFGTVVKGFELFNDIRRTNAVVDKTEQELANEKNRVLSPEKAAEFIRGGGAILPKMNPNIDPNALRQSLRNPDGTFEEVYLHKPIKEKSFQHTGTSGDVAFDPSTGYSYDRAGRRIYTQAPNKEKNDKATADFAKHLVSTSAELEGMRGNPAVQQAEKDIYAAGKATSLIKQFGDDPNNLTPQATSLLVSEIGKIASGGVPSIHELEVLTPATLQSKFAGIMQKITGDPSPANVGAFLKQYKDYAEGLTADAEKVITERYGRILDSRKRLLEPSDYENLKSQYVDRFKRAAEEGLVRKKEEQEAYRNAALEELKKRGISPKGK